MEKTKLSIPVSVFAAAACFLCYYGGYIAAGLVVGYVLLKEENVWLKKFSAKLLALMILFSLASTVLGFLPSLLELLYTFLNIFNVHFYLDFVHDFFNFIGQILSIIKMLLFVALGITALLGKEFKLPVLDPFLDKHIA